MNISSFGKKTGNFLSTNSPAILMGLSLAGVLTTTWLTHKAAQKAQLDILEVEDTTPAVALTAKEKVQLTWKHYIPPALSCGATLAFIIAGNTVQNKRQAALVTAVSLGETAFSEYKEKMVETLGKNKEKKARDEIVQDNVLKHEKEFEGLTILETNDVLCFETITGRPFISNAEKINRAANIVARHCINNDYASLNSFYRELGLPEVPVGETLGFNNANPLEIDLSSAQVHEGKPVLAIRYEFDPVVNYDSPW